MLRIAKKLSETETASFSIFEDVQCESEKKPSCCNVEVQTEISCDHVSLSTEVSISSDGKEDPNEHPELVFWRSVATQRASELDGIKEEVEKIVSLTMRNIAEKKELDNKHDELYSQLQRILESSDGEEDSGTPASEERQIT